MTGHLSVLRVRRLLISRFFAGLIVVLAITPFTAPFSSFGLAELVSEKSLHGSSDSGKLADDLTDLAFLVVHALPTLAADYGFGPGDDRAPRPAGDPDTRPAHLASGSLSLFVRAAPRCGSARRARVARESERPLSRPWRRTMTVTVWKRLKEGMADPHMRANVLALLGGKAIGLTLLLTAMSIYLPPALHAQATPPGPTPEINAINTVWVLIAAFLVFGMQVGFVMLEAGFARSRESINILVEGIVDTCICGVTFWAWGFAFMFEPGNGFIGTTGFFLKGIADTYVTTGVPLLAFWVFQFAFADTCSTITSGAMVGRCGFIGDILYSIGVTGFIYPIIGHWAWGPDGWLAVMPTPFRDFAGSTVVHSIGGAISLAGAIALGPRLGRVFRRDGGGPPLPHNIILGAVGGLILWFGWYGFNPGSTLSAMDMQGIGARLVQHDDGGVLGGPGGAVLRLRARRQVGPRPHDQRLPRRPRRDHLPLLLGQPDRRVLHRHRRRRGRHLGD